MQTGRMVTGGGTRLKKLGMAAGVLLFTLLALAVVLLYRGLREGREIRRYVGGPFGAQLLYVQGCAKAAVLEGGLPATLAEQFRSCPRSTWRARAGYYVYDFNIRRSIALSEADMELWREYSVLSFPATLTGRVEKSETNPFNRIISFETFAGFQYDCAPADDGNFSCRQASASCINSDHAIRCSVFNPRTGQTEAHVIEGFGELDLLLPQGFIAGSDLFKMLRPRFFPLVDLSERF